MTVLYIIAAILVLVGLAGIIVPALPGIPLIFAGMLLAAWTDGFDKVGAWTLAALGVLTLLSVAVDFWATAVGARRVGASRLAIIGAVLGTFAGLFFGPLGLFVGPFAGAMAGELPPGRGWRGTGHPRRLRHLDGDRVRHRAQADARLRDARPVRVGVVVALAARSAFTRR